MIKFSEFMNEKVKAIFKKGDIILNHLGEKPFKKIKDNQYITDNGKIDIKFQNSYKISK